MSSPLEAVIVGAGHRALCYAEHARRHPGDLRIVGLAEPDSLRRRQVAQAYDLPADRVFESASALAQAPKFADLAINGTMDHQHVPTALPLIEAGYHHLLEKPLATSEDEMLQLVEAARRNQRTVLICHVLRYAPFYAAIRERVARGDLGLLMSVQTVEHVSYHHMAVGFIRGKWSNKSKCRSSILMAKCCHDLDVVAWMKSGVRPRKVSSFGGRMYFRPEMAPEGAGTRCLVDCSIEDQCPYSARKHYVEPHPRWGFYAWAPIEDIENPTKDDKLESLRTSDFGRCVWACDNDVVDHQTVSVEFEDGSVASHNLVGGSARSLRRIHLVGTLGEIEGAFEDQAFTFRTPAPELACGHREELVKVNVNDGTDGSGGGHGGAEPRLMADLINVLRGKPTSLSSTTLDDSIFGHLIGFRADLSMAQGGAAVEIPSDFAADVAPAGAGS